MSEQADLKRVHPGLRGDYFEGQRPFVAPEDGW